MRKKKSRNARARPPLPCGPRARRVRERPFPSARNAANLDRLKPPDSFGGEEAARCCCRRGKPLLPRRARRRRSQPRCLRRRALAAAPCLKRWAAAAASPPLLSAFVRAARQAFGRSAWRQRALRAVSRGGIVRRGACASGRTLAPPIRRRALASSALDCFGAARSFDFSSRRRAFRAPRKGAGARYWGARSITRMFWACVFRFGL